jgi:hypothetical protein
MEYEIIVDALSNMAIIKATDENGNDFWIPFDEANTDYQQYLVDTDGGLPLPKETKEDK